MEVWFFPLKKGATDDPGELAEALAGLVFCLATVETALKKAGEVVNIPGTLEYGSKHTGGLRI